MVKKKATIPVWTCERCGTKNGYSPVLCEKCYALPLYQVTGIVIEEACLGYIRASDLQDAENQMKTRKKNFGKEFKKLHPDSPIYIKKVK